MQSMRRYFFLIALIILNSSNSFANTLSNVFVEDVYVDSQGNVAFGIKVFSHAFSPDGGGWAGNPIETNPSKSILESLCIARLGGGGDASTNLRFIFVGEGTNEEMDEKKALAISKLLKSKITGSSINLTYTPSALVALTSSDSRYKDCLNGIADLSVVTDIN